MRLFSFLLTSSLLHSTGLGYGRWGPRSDGNLDEEILKPDPEPLHYRADGPTLMEIRLGYPRGPTLMETGLGYPRNGTARRDQTLDSRQVWDPPGTQ
jgi:hypothetical protein